MLIAQITDLHIKLPGSLAYRRVDTAALGRAAIAHLAALDPAPDVVLVTGDLVDAGAPEEYAHLRELLAAIEAPLYIIPGNHDARDAMVRAFPDQRYWPGEGDFLHYVIDDHPLRLIALDTVVPGASHGEICAARRDWLDRRLAEEPERPTVIFMHHPPFACGITGIDAIGLNGADELAAVVRAHPQVERVLCGHVHRPVQARWGGTVASVAPSTAHQLSLDLRPDATATFIFEPPGYQLHHWRPDGPLVTHTVAVGDFGGPHAFYD